MGGLKHVVHKRVHLERQQPSARQRLGFLEKHKDYTLRAKDYHSKQDQLKNMHRKAFFRNPDEFDAKMLKMTRRQTGALTKKKDQHLSDAQKKLLDTQDARYVGMREVTDRKAVEKR